MATAPSRWARRASPIRYSRGPMCAFWRAMRRATRPLCCACRPRRLWLPARSSRFLARRKTLFPSARSRCFGGEVTPGLPPALAIFPDELLQAGSPEAWTMAAMNDLDRQALQPRHGCVVIRKVGMICVQDQLAVIDD